MNSIAVYGADFFGPSDFPLIVGRSLSRAPRPGDPPPHPLDYTETEHHHDFSELVIVSNGLGMHCLEGVDFPIAAGDVFLLQGEQRHYFHHREDLELINVMFDPVRIALLEHELRRMPGYCAMFMLEPTYRQQHRFASRLHLNREDLARVQAITGRMELECSVKGSGYETLLRAKLLELIAYLARAYEGGGSTEAESLLRVSHVIGALEKDYSKQWRLDEIVGISNMSKSNLLTIFRKATGQTPIDYLMGIRIQRATEVLLTTDDNITEIAFASGFNDSNYFTRQFRKVTGKSPRDFRAHHNR